VIELLPGSMKTVDMIADNPGTWMFHCHVEDHMEFGMMAVFTVAAPPSRSCPMEFLGGDFWKEPEKFTLRVKNTSSKTIASFAADTGNVLHAAGFAASLHGRVVVNEADSVGRGTNSGEAWN